MYKTGLDYAQVVFVRARCTVHGFGGREVTVPPSPGNTNDYEVRVSE